MEKKEPKVKQQQLCVEVRVALFFFVVYLSREKKMQFEGEKKKTE